MVCDSSGRCSDSVYAFSNFRDSVNLVNLDSISRTNQTYVSTDYCGSANGLGYKKDK